MFIKSKKDNQFRIHVKEDFSVILEWVWTYQVVSLVHFMYTCNGLFKKVPASYHTPHLVAAITAQDCPLVGRSNPRTAMLAR